MNTREFYLTRFPSDFDAQPVLIPRPDIEWESVAVFNPGVIADGGLVRMLYRTYPSETHEGKPRPHRQGKNLIDQRSYIGYADSRDGIHFERRDEPFIIPDMPYDRHGCEDPRITRIGDTFYITYTAIDGPLGDGYDEPHIRIALATTKDFVDVTKHGIIGPDRTSKAAALFSEPVNGGRIGLIMTINSDSTNSHVATRYYDSIESMMNQTAETWDEFLQHSRDTAALKTEWWLHRGPELGAPPIRTEKGWLLIYSPEAMGHVWTVGAALLDLDEPHKLIARTPGFILQPVARHECEGLVPQVTFPSAAIVQGDELYVYYGAADTTIGLATCKIEKILAYLSQFEGLG